MWKTATIPADLVRTRSAARVRDLRVLSVDGPDPAPTLRHPGPLRHGWRTTARRPVVSVTSPGCSLARDAASSA